MTSKPVVTFSAYRDDCSDCSIDTCNSAATTEPTTCKTSTDSPNSSVTSVHQDQTATEQEPSDLDKNSHNKTLNSTHGSYEKNPNEIICVVAVSRPSCEQTITLVLCFKTYFRSHFSKGGCKKQ